jgi:hypothetical protein
MTDIRLFVAGITIACSVLGAQNVTLDPGKWSESGIDLTPYSSPTFSAKLAAATPASRLDLTPLYPFSFFLTNNTGHNIIAYSVQWIVTNPNGSVFRHTRMVGGLQSPHNNLTVPKGANRLVTIVNGAVAPIINDPRTTSQVISGISNEVPKALSIFPKGSTVAIALEAVVLDDGSAIGPDVTYSVAQMQAKANAERTLALEIVAKFNAGGDQAVLDFLNGIVSQKDPNVPNVISASSMPSRDAAYAAFLIVFRNQAAAQYLRLANANPALLMNVVNAKANAPTLAAQP